MSGDRSTNRAIAAAMIVAAGTVVGAFIMATPGILGLRSPETRSEESPSEESEGLSEHRVAMPMEPGNVELRSNSEDASSTEATGERTQPSIEATEPIDSKVEGPSAELERQVLDREPAASTNRVGIVTRSLRDGQSVTIEGLGVVLGAEFKETAGVAHVDVVFTATGRSTRRLAAMGSGAEHEVRVGSRDYTLVVSSIDWQRKTVNVTLNPMGS